MLYYSEEETKVSTELKKLCYYHIKEGTFFQMHYLLHSTKFCI